MDRKGVNMRLNEIELAQVEVLRHGSSREQWFRNVILALSKDRAAIEELAIQSYRMAARAAHDDMDHDRAAEYNRLIAEADKNLAILRRRAE